MVKLSSSIRQELVVQVLGPVDHRISKNTHSTIPFKGILMVALARRLRNQLIPDHLENSLKRFPSQALVSRQAGSTLEVDRDVGSRDASSRGVGGREKEAEDVIK